MNRAGWVWNNRGWWELWGAGGMSLPTAFAGLKPGGVFLQIFAELPSANLRFTHIAYCPAPVFPMVFLWKFYAATPAKLLQSCLTPCDPIDSSPLDSSVPGILQARILEWVAISFSNA